MKVNQIIFVVLLFIAIGSAINAIYCRKANESLIRELDAAYMTIETLSNKGEASANQYMKKRIQAKVDSIVIDWDRLEAGAREE